MRDNGLSGFDEAGLQVEIDKVRIFNTYPAPQNRADSMKLVLFNVERGRHLNEIEAYIKYHPSLKDADVIFFNELDDGMARTGNIDTTAEFSNRLSMNYIFGVEFLELTIGDKEEKMANKSGHNTKGFHGNAILSRYELLDPVLIRLPVLYDWYYDDQKRLGGRIALLTKIKVNNRFIGLVCTHLENKTSPLMRKKQMEYILEYAKKHFGEIPVIISGDMNTNACGPEAEEFIKLYENPSLLADIITYPENYEPLLKLVEDYGYEYRQANVSGKITRRKPIAGKGDLELNLDWFFVKGLKCSAPAVVNTIFSIKELEFKNLKETTYADGLEISDHNVISLKCTVEA